MKETHKTYLINNFSLKINLKFSDFFLKIKAINKITKYLNHINQIPQIIKNIVKLTMNKYILQLQTKP